MTNRHRVPTKFNLDSFFGHGVHKDKLHIVGEPVDVDFFDPSKYDKVEKSTPASLMDCFVFA